MDLLIDFSSIERERPKKKTTKKPGYEKDYTDLTVQYYKAHRVKITDPITFEELSDKTCFKYSKMWNPYNGDVLQDDPFGPLCFNPITLLTHIYQFRLMNLWITQSDEEEGLYEGYYGEGVGASDNFEIIGRGTYPERYLFRVPVTNCYLTQSHNMSYVTMGPRLTDRDVCEIDRLITKHWSHHRSFRKIYKKIGSLYKLKRYYDVAISKKPIEMDLVGLNIDQNIAKNQDDPNAYINRVAVEEIKKMS